MAAPSIRLPAQPAQTAFNLRRWKELLGDAELAEVEGRMETDRHGHILLSPPTAPRHGSIQARSAARFDQMMPHGRVLTECPISTADGGRAADVAWASAEALRALGHRACFPRSPELCVEVLSPANTEAEIAEKVALYFDAGAREVSLCDPAGRVALSCGPRPCRRTQAYQRIPVIRRFPMPHSESRLRPSG
jgi:Uma2 family endonuclease